LTTQVTTDRGEPFSLEQRRVWEPILGAIDGIVGAGQADCQLDVLAGAQIGKSTLACGVLGALPTLGWNSLYFLPTDILASRFDDTRWAPMARRAPWLVANLGDGTGGETDRKGLHSISGRWVYILGLESLNNAISIQGDALIYDEADLIPADNLAWSADRIDASKLRLQLSISVGMLEGAGIDERYKSGCQYVWVVRCPRCNRDGQVLEELFPDCVQMVDGAWARVCIACGRPYDVESCGRWVPRFPSREADGRLSWRIPQLIVPAVSLVGVMRKWEKARSRRSRLAKFKCSTLAMPDGGELQPITDAVLQRCRGEAPMRLERGDRPRYSGIDTGDSVHYAAHERLPDGRMRYVWFEEIDSDVMVERIEALDEALGVVARVCDAKPLRTEARRLAYAKPHSTWLLDFAGDGEEPKSVSDSHGDQVFQRAVVGRDAALDDLVAQFVAQPPCVVLPTNDGRALAVLDLCDQHLKALAKERKEDARGNTIETFKRNVANHLGLAMLSSTIAEQLHRDSVPAAWRSIARREMPAELSGVGSRRMSRRLLENY
jgi:hypothetical protein